MLAVVLVSRHRQTEGTQEGRAQAQHKLLWSKNQRLYSKSGCYKEAGYEAEAQKLQAKQEYEDGQKQGAMGLWRILDNDVEVSGYGN